MTRYRPLALPFFTTLIAFAILIGLGKWQLDRREWKLGIIDRIETRVHDEPISLSLAKREWTEKQDVEYYRVLLVGRFLHDDERYLYTLVDGKAGWRVITPLQVRGGEIVLVDRGFVPEELKDPATRKPGQIGGTVEMIGLAPHLGAPEPVHAGQSAGDQSLVLARYCRAQGLAPRRSCRQDRAVPGRGGEVGCPRRLAAGRCHPSGAAQSSP